MTDKPTNFLGSVDAEAEFEASKESDNALLKFQQLERDLQLRDAVIRRERQVSNLRNLAFGQAIVVCLGFAGYLGFMVWVIWQGGFPSLAPTAQAAVFATPILAIAAITIFVLRGVFGTPSSKSVTEELKNASSIASDLGQSG